MGQQFNKVIKRARRKKYLQRCKIRAKTARMAARKRG